MFQLLLHSRAQLFGTLHEPRNGVWNEMERGTACALQALQIAMPKVGAADAEEKRRGSLMLSASCLPHWR